MDKYFIRLKLVLILIAVTFVCTKGQFCSNTSYIYPYFSVRDVCAEGVAAPPSVKKAYNSVPCCQTCSCSSDCLYHNDCCPDADVRKLNNKPDIKCTAPLYNDERILANVNGNNYGVNMYNMITSCLKTHPNDSIFNKCERTVPGDIRSAIVVSDTNDRVYKNEYCALCNRVYNYTTWRLGIQTFSHDNTFETFRPVIDSLIKNKYIFWSLSPRQNIGQRSRCFVPLYNACNVTGKWLHYDKELDNACANFTLPYIHNEQDLFDDTNIYKNIFCYLCNQEPDAKLPKTCKVSAKTDVMASKSNYVMSFSGFLNIDAAGRLDKSNLQAKEFKCRLEEVYDAYFNICRKLQCPLGMFPIHGDCFNTYTAERGRTFAIVFEATLPTQTVENDKQLNKIIQILSYKMKDLGIKRIGCGVCHYQINEDVKHTHSGYIVVMVVHTTSKCNTQTIWTFFESLKSTPYNFIVKVKENISTTATLELRKMYTPISFKETPSMRLMVSHSKTACLPPTLLTGLNCPRVELNGSEYDVLYTPGENIHGKEYVIKNVYFNNATNETNKTYELCLKTFQNHINLKLFENKSISTGNTNSVMFLVATFLISVILHGTMV